MKLLYLFLVSAVLLVSQAPDEWRWGYIMFVGIHLALVVGPGGRRLALDARLHLVGGARLPAPRIPEVVEQARAFQFQQVLRLPVE